jgi:hypothetical protein
VIAEDLVRYREAWEIEKITPADPARRLVIEWTGQLPATQRGTATQLRTRLRAEGRRAAGHHCFSLAS